ncbi:MAG: glycosyltransferase [Anaerolineaceae bacterium]|jgi:1,2-diacylglycerol 3-beta-galactosyltransferase
MMTSPVKKPHIMFLFSDTGGGHRSASEAIIEALNLEFPERYTWEMVDFFKDYAPFPLNYSGETYPTFSSWKLLWKASYSYADNKQRMKGIYDVAWPVVRKGAHRLVAEHPCDLILSVHPLINLPVLRCKPHQIPMVAVITDLVTTPVAWYQPALDNLVVPTVPAYERGLKLGMRPDQMAIIGLPVADKFCHPVADRMALRESLGWSKDCTIVLIIGGGDGMGPLAPNAFAIDDLGTDLEVVVVAGRNHKLKTRLEAHNWKHPHHIYGFVRQLPDFMQASDIMVSKAGPGTISEAFIAGLPVILYSMVPGQEEGNVTYVTDNGAGVWAPKPALVAETVLKWVQHSEERQKFIDISKNLARPDASRQIARLIGDKVGLRQD